jgi:hypothetical protein
LRVTFWWRHGQRDSRDLLVVEELHDLEHCQLLVVGVVERNEDHTTWANRNPCVAVRQEPHEAAQPV